jgi:trans-aconitate 2-methyltransferase
VAWDPPQYLRYADERLRPALDLLARIALEAPARIADLGCGAGNVTRLLKARWPQAQVTGIDSSAEMLARAAGELPDARWVCADVAGWQPEVTPDLVFSNAALHWLDDHATLFPKLAGFVAPGGTLAVQMPDNFAAPSHTCAFDAALAGPWRERLAPLLRRAPVLAPEAYYALLAPLARSVEVWRTEYLHALSGNDAVAQWTRGSLLVPLLDALPDPAERAAFEADYRARVAAAYPPRPDGRTLLPFRRLFVVARF